MTRRARYDGGYLDGVVVEVEPGQLVHVKQGGLLPADAPAAVRDELLSREDWSEVKDASGSKSDKGE